ncbi:MAG: GIY-YIG nuclease family protein [Bacteroidota bacterium]
MYVYVLKSMNNYRFYVGMTENVERRLKEHNSGKTKSTKGYRPWQLFFSEEYPNREEARQREKYLKSGVGKEYIKREWSRSPAGYLPAGREQLTSDQ